MFIFADLIVHYPMHVSQSISFAGRNVFSAFSASFSHLSCSARKAQVSLHLYFAENTCSYCRAACLLFYRNKKETAA